MFAPQWKSDEYETAVISDEMISKAVSKAIINIDVEQKKGALYEMCKNGSGGFKALDDMLDKLKIVPSDAP